MMEHNSGIEPDIDDAENEKEEIDEDSLPLKRSKGRKTASKNKPLKLFQVVEEIPIEFDFTPADKHTSDEDPDDPPFEPARPPTKRARKMTTPQRSRAAAQDRARLPVPAPQAAPVGGETDPLATVETQPRVQNNNRTPKYQPPPTINRYPCGFCDTVFTDMSFLERHHKRCKAKRAAESAGAHRGGPGPSPRSAPTVIAVPGNRQTYSCDQCTFTTKNPEHLKYHKPIHNDDKFFSCEECKFTCRELEQLNNHKKMHSGYKEFMYVQDGFDSGLKPEKAAEKMDANPQNQEFDERVDDSGAKTFSCEQCSYTSSRPGYLVMHRRIHVREKPYECLDCGYKCTRLAYFKKHRATHMTGADTLECDRCSFTATSQIVLDAHKQCHKV